MVGVPPLPSNYAQRAGRAGRGSGDNYALIVTFCSEYSNHDVYYFNQPKKMINGVISPPSFNPANLEVIKKHVHAFLLADATRNVQELEGFFRNLATELGTDKLNKLRQIFGQIPLLEEYLLGDGFREELRQLIAKARGNRRSIRQLCYAEGFFPDYAFRKDQVFVVDKESLILLGQQNGKLGTGDLAEYSLSEREPELAYYKFSPGETVFMAGDIYDILSSGDGYDVIRTEENRQVRTYRYFEAARQVYHAAKSKIYKKYELSQCLSGQETHSLLNEQYRVVKISYYPKCLLSFHNNGLLEFSRTKQFQDNEGTFAIAYHLEREAIAMKFDAHVCADQKLYLSLASALDRAIKDKYGLDEGELRLLVGVKNNTDNLDTGNSIYVLFYDFGGNGNVPLKKIFAEFDQVVVWAYDKMTQCSDCPGGCYACMKSYNTHHYADNVDKQTALMFTGYLLGKDKFKPAIPKPDIGTEQFDLILQIEQQREGFIVRSQTSGRVCEDQVNESQNKTIFQLLTRMVGEEFSPQMKTLKICSKVDYIVDAIQRGHVKTDKDAFAHLQFNLLRFKQVIAEKA